MQLWFGWNKHISCQPEQNTMLKRNTLTFQHQWLKFASHPISKRIHVFHVSRSLPLAVYIYIRKDMCIYMVTYIHIETKVCIHRFCCLYVWIYIYVHISHIQRIYIYIYVHICEYIRLKLFVYVYMYICIYTSNM